MLNERREEVLFSKQMMTPGSALVPFYFPGGGLPLKKESIFFFLIVADRGEIAS
jgi:hypothetical protein